MNKILTPLLLLLILNYGRCFADAMPFKDKAQIDFSYKTSSPIQFDSCGIIYSNNYTNQLDTFFRCDGAECIFADKNSIHLIRLVPDKFRVVFYFGNKVLISPTLNENGLKSYHRLLITDTEVEDITPIFKTTYANYFIALSSTIALELLIAFSYFRRHKIPLTNLTYIIFVNLFTHPVLWILSANLTGFMAGNLIGEPIVMIIEARLLSGFIKPTLSVGKSTWLSIQMNLISFIVGGFIYIITAA